MGNIKTSEHIKHSLDAAVRKELDQALPVVCLAVDDTAKKAYQSISRVGERFRISPSGLALTHSAEKPLLENAIMKKTFLLTAALFLITGTVAYGASDVRGSISNPSPAKASAGASAGKNNNASTGTAPVKDSAVRGTVTNQSDVKGATNVASGQVNKASAGSVALEKSNAQGAVAKKSNAQGSASK